MTTIIEADVEQAALDWLTVRRYTTRSSCSKTDSTNWRITDRGRRLNRIRR